MTDLPIVLSGVSFEVSGKELVKSVSLRVSQGEFVGLIGPNGAGKTTLLNLVGGRLSTTAGSVDLLGEDIRGSSPMELALKRSMISRPMMAPVAYTVRTVVEAGRNPHRRTPGNSAAKDSDAVDRAMTITRVDGMSSRPYGTLSSGEQARAQIARILAQEAPVALLDEPTASLDLANTELILSVLTEGLDEHHTTVCVLHDLNAASYYADRLILMFRGEVVADGPPRAVLQPQLLSEVYGIAMTVIDHPTRGSPLVLPTL